MSYVPATIAAVRALRDRSDASLARCKLALEDAGGDEAAAMKLLIDWSNGIRRIDPGALQGLTPSAYLLPENDFGTRSSIELCSQKDGSVRWAVRNNGSCLDVDGYWDVEPSPSNRDDEFLSHCRFATAKDAFEVWKSRKQETQTQSHCGQDGASGSSRPI